MIKQKFALNKFWLLILILPLFLSGCLGINVSKKDTSAGTNLAYGGIFRTTDLGKTWSHITNLYTIGSQAANFNAANITTYAMDPSDPAAVYVGTQANGIYYSYNYGEGWHNTLRDVGNINSIAIDPKDKCTIYAAVHNSLYKTTDCSRNWERTYFETKAGQYITTVAIDNIESKIVYVGTSDGKFLKSQDYGYSWDTIHRFDNRISSITVLHHLPENILYIYIANMGLYRSTDGANTFEDLMVLPIVEPNDPGRESTTNFREARDINALSLGMDRSVRDGILFITPVGLFRLRDGQVWEQVELLSPNKGDTIYAAEVNPANTNEIFYGTMVAIYHTIDGGKNWDVSPLPTPNSSRFLKFSGDNKAMYLGTFFIRQE